MVPHQRPSRLPVDPPEACDGISSRLQHQPMRSSSSLSLSPSAARLRRRSNNTTTTGASTHAYAATSTFSTNNTTNKHAQQYTSTTTTSLSSSTSGFDRFLMITFVSIVLLCFVEVKVLYDHINLDQHQQPMQDDEFSKSNIINIPQVRMQPNNNKSLGRDDDGGTMLRRRHSKENEEASPSAQKKIDTMNKREEEVKVKSNDKQDEKVKRMQSDMKGKMDNNKYKDTNNRDASHDASDNDDVVNNNHEAAEPPPRTKSNTKKKVLPDWNIQPIQQQSTSTSTSTSSTTQRIIFLAGPHRSHSSALQTIATHFTHIYPEWTLSDPWGNGLHKHDVIRSDEVRHFSALLYPMIGQSNHPTFVNPPVDEREMTELFKSDLERKWEEKRNVIMGSEDVVDSILADHLNGEDVLDKILSILPPSTRQVTDVVITYRSPKVQHLLSLWEEVGVQVWNETLSEFIFDPATFLQVHRIEVLPMVDMFLRRGLQVTLVDVDGLKKNGVDVIQLMGCDLMKEACTSISSGSSSSISSIEGENNKNDLKMIPDFLKEVLTQTPELMTVLKKSSMNDDVRTSTTRGIMDLDDAKLEGIERVIQQYDCEFRDLVVKHENLTILYDADFVKNMDACVSVSGNDGDDDGGSSGSVEKKKERMERKELWNEIKMIADPERAVAERKKNIILFAGPHFSSMEFMHILSIHFSAIMRTKWAWVAPPAIKQYFKLTEPAYLASLIFALSGQTTHPLFTTPGTVTKELIYDIFKDDIANLIRAEKNILLGSDELDRITSDDFDGEGILDDILSMLTTIDNEEGVHSHYETTVVIGYVSPRVDHLLSLWNEVAGPTKKTLYDFTLDLSSIHHLHTIDPLSLANKFLKRGVKVVLLDVAGHDLARAETYKTLACDIMLEPCGNSGSNSNNNNNNNNNDPKFIDVHRKVHPDIMDVISIDPTNKDKANRTSLRLDSGLSEKQLAAIDNELRRCDCNHRHDVLGHENMTVLYDVVFSKNMKECGDDDNDGGLRQKKIVSRKDMWTVISSWADPNHDVKASLRASFLRHSE